MSDLLLPRSDVGEFRRRYKWLALFAVAAFGAIVLRLLQLQIVEGGAYSGVARDNIIRKAVLPTTRGVIRDANGKVLASSRPAYNVTIVPGRVMPSARVGAASTRARADERDTFGRIADALRLNPDERDRLESRIRDACAQDMGAPARSSPCWRPILVKEDVARDIVAELKQHQAEMAGAEVVSAPVRFYPYKTLGAHVLGYIAEIDAETLAKHRPPGFDAMSADDKQKVNPLAYESGDYVGATGVERAWESYLRGQKGWEKRVVDAHGRYRSGPSAERLIDQPARQEPLPGRDLRLTLDIELEQAAEKALRGQPAGAAVVVDVKTGRLLALYSKPEFDPNDLAGGGGKARIREAFAKLEADPLRPLLDKTTSGAFHPGSTFKPFSALAALEDKLMPPDDRERCDGVLAFGRRLFHCTHVHGKVNMHDAIAQSCNIYFFKLAEATGMDRIAKMAAEFGLGQKTGLGVNPEATGRVPTRSWYALRYKGQFRIGFTLNASIGQGATTVTPLQLALAYGALANGGTLYLPQLVRAVEMGDGSVVQDFPPRVRHKVGVNADNLSLVNDALFGVVNDPKGTAYPVRDATFEIAGKTGTAQTGYVSAPTDDPKKAWFYSRDHAWFASYYPAKAPEIAVVVLVEHGGSGPTQAAPLAIQITREYARLTALRAGKPPPPPKPSAGSGAGASTTGAGAPAGAGGRNAP
jgi:penicillin-binding protein 2